MEDILLVDDEQPVLDSLLSALDWAEYGFKNIHTALSASAALDVLSSHNIDLLVSDILMPDMNGLEMLKIVRSRYPSTHCVLLSAHSKFEYARDALRLGVENYLLKPIDVVELRETVYRTVKNIDYTNAISHDLYDRNILVRWLYGRISSDELVEHSRYTKLNVLLRRYRVIYIQCANHAQQLMNHLGKCLSLNYTIHDLLLDDHTGFLPLGCRDVSDETVFEAIYDLLPIWKNALIVCGSLATGNSEVLQSRTDAMHAAEYARLAGASGWVSYDRICWDILNVASLSQLEDILHLEYPEKAAQDWAIRHTISLTAAALPDLYAQACMMILHIVNKQNMPQSSKLTLSPWSGESSVDNAVVQLVSAILDGSRVLRQGCRGISPVINRVLQYVTENLSSSISIKQFAEQAKMNATYIGRLFKEEMNMYFSDYVCLTRINKAKTLLETTALSVGDIAHQVGIYDVSYFTQCFKKQERLSPMKYRQQMRGK